MDGDCNLPGLGLVNARNIVYAAVGLAVRDETTNRGSQFNGSVPRG